MGQPEDAKTLAGLRRASHLYTTRRAASAFCGCPSWAVATVGLPLAAPLQGAEGQQVSPRTPDFLPGLGVN